MAIFFFRLCHVWRFTVWLCFARHSAVAFSLLCFSSQPASLLLLAQACSLRFASRLAGVPPPLRPHVWLRLCFAELCRFASFHVDAPGAAAFLFCFWRSPLSCFGVRLRFCLLISWFTLASFVDASLAPLACWRLVSSLICLRPGGDDDFEVGNSSTSVCAWEAVFAVRRRPGLTGGGSRYMIYTAILLVLIERNAPNLHGYSPRNRKRGVVCTWWCIKEIQYPSFSCVCLFYLELMELIMTGCGFLHNTLSPIFSCTALYNKYQMRINDWFERAAYCCSGILLCIGGLSSISSLGQSRSMAACLGLVVGFAMALALLV